MVKRRKTVRKSVAHKKPAVRRRRSNPFQLNAKNVLHVKNVLNPKIMFH